MIGVVKPDEDMPVDEFGNRADVVVDSAPTIGRMIFSRPYAHYIAAGSREIRRRIRELAGWTTPMSIYDVEDLRPEVRAAIWDQLLLIYKCLPGPQYRDYLNLSEEDRNTTIMTALNKEVYLYNNPNDIWHTEERVSEKGLGAAETCRLIRKFIAPPRSRVWYRNSCGELKLTKDKVRIAPLYHMLLEKTPQEYSATATSTVQHQGLLSPAARSEGSRDPYRNRTVRTKCEVGTRIDLAFMGAEATVETMDRYNNPEAMAAQVQSIFEDAGGPKRYRMVDRSKVSIDGHRALQLLKHALLCMGISVRYVPPKFKVRRIHEQPNNHLENNDVTVPRS